MLRGVTFDDQNLVMSADHGMYQRALTGSQDGIVKGCAVTTSANKIYVSAGLVQVCGRLIVVQDIEEIIPEDIIGLGYIRLKLVVDLTVVPVLDTFVQGYWDYEYSVTVGGFGTLIQQDINDDGTKYEVAFALGTIVANNITGIKRSIQKVIFPGLNGWNVIYEENDEPLWSFDSNLGGGLFTINVPDNAYAVFQKGTKIYIGQYEIVKYFYVVDVLSATKIKVCGGSDYSVDNVGIWTAAFSHSVDPLGFPDWFNWVPGLTVGSADLNGYDIAKFNIKGRTFGFVFATENRSMSGAAGSTIITFPVQSKISIQYFIDGKFFNGSSYISVRSILTANSNQLIIYKDAASASWAGNETGVYIRISGSFEIA